MTRRSPVLTVLVTILIAVFLSILHGEAQVSDRLPRPKAESLAERARRIHREAIVIDGYVGTTKQIQSPTFKFTDRHTPFDSHVDLPRMKEGGLDGAFFAVGGLDVINGQPSGPQAIRESLEGIDALNQLAKENPDKLSFCETSAQVRRAHREGKTAIMIGMYGGHNIAEDLSILRTYSRLGVRYMHLTHDTHTSWSDAAAAKPVLNGLTDFGRQVVREMNRLGMMVDISHVADGSAWDALKTSIAPVIASHSSARTLCQHPRDMPDEMIKALAAKGGIIMVNYNLFFLDEEYRQAWDKIQPELRTQSRELRERYPGVENLPRWRAEGALWLAPRMPQVPWTRIVDHIDHIVKLVGVDSVGLGSDFDGALMPQGMEDCSQLPKITEELLRRGYQEIEVRKILGENILRVMDRVDAVGRRMRSASQ